jgi:phage shock protein A
MSFYLTVEYRNPVKMVDMKNLVNEVNEMQAQLEELYRYVTELIEEGDKDTAREMIEANQEVIVEQLESGYQGMEQVAMLDILAQLRMRLHDFEEAEFLLDQVSSHRPIC